MSRHRVTISSTGLVHTVTLDGHDISRGVRSATLALGPAGQLPELTLEPIVIEVAEWVGEDVRVVITDETADALIKLGWTPPE